MSDQIGKIFWVDDSKLYQPAYNSKRRPCIVVDQIGDCVAVVVGKSAPCTPYTMDSPALSSMSRDGSPKYVDRKLYFSKVCGELLTISDLGVVSNHLLCNDELDCLKEHIFYNSKTKKEHKIFKNKASKTVVV